MSTLIMTRRTLLKTAAVLGAVSAAVGTIPTPALGAQTEGPAATEVKRVR